MKENRFCILLHSIGNSNSIRVDFNSMKSATSFYKELKIEGYEIYQFIQEEFKYNMEESELKENKIEFKSFKREKKTWFGFSKKLVTDLLIYPQKGFFYPYQYGHYFYLYSNEKIDKDQFEKWLNSMFPVRFSDFDETYAGVNKDKIQLMKEDDYLLITNHDYQEEFGLIGNQVIIQRVVEKFRAMNLKSYEEQLFIC